MYKFIKIFFILIFINILLPFFLNAKSNSIFHSKKIDTDFKSIILKLKKNKNKINSLKYRMKIKKTINKFVKFAKKNTNYQYKFQILVQIADLYYVLAKKTQEKNDWLLCINTYKQLWKKYSKNPNTKKILEKSEYLKKYYFKLIKKRTIFINKKINKNNFVINKKIKIIVDAGHGGVDNGNIGFSGLKEKKITLSIAHKVVVQIKKQMPYVKVYMTRNKDKNMSLKERTNFANKISANMFISIHANFAKNKNRRGIETYYLDITHNRYPIRLFARENITFNRQISDLEYILADMNMKSNTKKSIKLGKLVQKSIITMIRKVWEDTKDLGLKHNMLYVLLGAKMPAILVETSFISNYKDEKRLNLRSYQNFLAAGIVLGIKRYIEEEKIIHIP